MILVDVLPKSNDGRIVLSPAGSTRNKPIDGLVDVEWFKSKFVDLANTTIPLNNANLKTLKGIDDFWSVNADRWRENGII